MNPKHFHHFQCQFKLVLPEEELPWSYKEKQVTNLDEFWDIIKSNTRHPENNTNANLALRVSEETSNLFFKGLKRSSAHMPVFICHSGHYLLEEQGTDYCFPLITSDKTAQLQSLLSKCQKLELKDYEEQYFLFNENDEWTLYKVKLEVYITLHHFDEDVVHHEKIPNYLWVNKWTVGRRNNPCGISISCHFREFINICKRAYKNTYNKNEIQKYIRQRNYLMLYPLGFHDLLEFYDEVSAVEGLQHLQSFTDFGKQSLKNQWLRIESYLHIVINKEKFLPQLSIWREEELKRKSYLFEGRDPFLHRNALMYVLEGEKSLQLRQDSLDLWAMESSFSQEYDAYLHHASESCSGMCFLIKFEARKFSFPSANTFLEIAYQKKLLDVLIEKFGDDLETDPRYETDPFMQSIVLDSDFFSYQPKDSKLKMHRIEGKWVEDAFERVQHPGNPTYHLEVEDLDTGTFIILPGYSEIYKIDRPIKYNGRKVFQKLINEKEENWEFYYVQTYFPLGLDIHNSTLEFFWRGMNDSCYLIWSEETVWFFVTTGAD